MFLSGGCRKDLVGKTEEDWVMVTPSSPHTLQFVGKRLFFFFNRAGLFQGRCQLRESGMCEVMSAVWIMPRIDFKSKGELRLFTTLHLFSSSRRTWPMICPRSWAGTSEAWSWVCSCWRRCTMPTSWGTQWRFEFFTQSITSEGQSPPGSTKRGNHWAGPLTRLCLSQGAGTEEACLIDILASRSNDEIKAINAFYKKRE